MADRFPAIVKEQMKRFPLMEPQDYGKLIFQSEFGAEHMIQDEDSVRTFLLDEWENLPPDQAAQDPEYIGGGLCRFPLSACRSAAIAKLLADLFILTAGQKRGSIENVYDKLNQIAAFQIPGMEEWAREWKQHSCPPVRHSQAYRNAYKPHYRLLKKEYAIFFPAISAIRSLLDEKEHVIIGIDGRCGSGKTRFAQLLGRLFSCNVIHMDDFYRPFGSRLEYKGKIPDGNIDFERLRTEVLLPVMAKKTAVYRRYSCKKDKMEDAVFLQPKPLAVIEGSYSHHPKMKACYDLKIFLTCSKEMQKKRLQDREGDSFIEFEKRWIPEEECYFAACKVETGSSLLTDTSEGEDF